MGVVRMYRCCKEVYRYPHNNYFFSLLHLYYLFFRQQHPYFFVNFKNVFSWLVGVVVRRYIDILIIIIYFPYSTCIVSFLGSSIPTSLFILKMFFRSCLCYFCAI